MGFDTLDCYGKAEAKDIATIGRDLVNTKPTPLAVDYVISSGHLKTVIAVLRKSDSQYADIMASTLEKLPELEGGYGLKRELDNEF